MLASNALGTFPEPIQMYAMYSSFILFLCSLGNIIMETAQSLKSLGKQMTCKAMIIKYPVSQTIFCYVSMQAGGICYYYYVPTVDIIKVPDHRSTVQFQISKIQ